MKEFLGEIIDPITDFYKIRNIKEKIILIIFPMLISCCCFIASFWIHGNSEFILSDFNNDLINQLITILTLFVSFSMAYLSIIVSSDSENIRELKGTLSKKRFINQEPCNLYQILMSEITYTLIIEIFFLLICVFEKFLVNIWGPTMGKAIVCIDVGLLIHVLIMMLVIVKNIYYSFWKSEKDK